MEGGPFLENRSGSIVGDHDEKVKHAEIKYVLLEIGLQKVVRYCMIETERGDQMEEQRKESKYAALCSDLREQIQQGIFGSGDKLPSEGTLSERYACSRQTVRQALNVLEHEGLIVRRRGSGTYVAGLWEKKQQTHRIGVITTYITDYIFPFIIKGIEETAAKSGYHLVFGATKNRVENEKRLLRAFLSDGIDGLIVEGTKSALPNPNLELYHELERAGLPVVFLNGNYRELKTSICVRTDDRKCGADAAAYLFRCGCRKLGGIFKSDDIQGHDRYAGFAKAVLQNGGTLFDDALFWYTTGDYETLFSTENLTRLLSALRQCDGVVCYNDQAAYDLLMVLLSHGISVPGQLAVIGVDHAGVSEYAPVKLTTFEHPKEKMGIAAAEKLLRMIETGEREKSEQFVMPLVPRESTGVPGKKSDKK